MKETIKTLIQRMASELIELQVQNARVKKGSVNRTACTCTAVLNNGVEIEDVKLRATIDDTDNGIIVFPKEESWIRVALIENNENNAFVVQYSDIDAFQIKKSNFKMEVKDNGDLVFNDGNNGALIKIQALEAKINTINANFQAIVSAALSGQTATVGAAPADGAAGFAAFVSALNAVQSINSSGMNNDKIKH